MGSGGSCGGDDSNSIAGTEVIEDLEGYLAVVVEGGVIVLVPEAGNEAVVDDEIDGS